MSVTRRDFIQSASVGTAAGGFFVQPGRRRQPISEGSLDLLIFLEGGIDPFSVLVPLQNRRSYERLRPNLLVDARSALPLERGWALNAALPALHQHWSTGKLRISLSEVDVEQSHVQAVKRLGQEFMPIEAFEGVVDSLPRIVAVPNSLTCLWPSQPKSRWRAFLGEVDPRRFSVGMWAEVMRECPNQLILALPGFDCHARAAAMMPAMLCELDSVFARVTAALERAGRTAVISICSELGRKLEQNTRAGTDHGEFFLTLRTEVGSPTIEIGSRCLQKLEV